MAGRDCSERRLPKLVRGSNVARLVRRWRRPRWSSGRANRRTGGTQKCFAKRDDERNTGKRIQGSGIRITIDNLETETAQQRAYERRESERVARVDNRSKLMTMKITKGRTASNRRNMGTAVRLHAPRRHLITNFECTCMYINKSLRIP